MTAAIAAGITGAAAAWGVIHWSIPASSALLDGRADNGRYHTQDWNPDG